jgi:exopolysaccharide biosynthesis polyprenyl glycosylphosphotransferase
MTDAPARAASSRADEGRPGQGRPALRTRPRKPVQRPLGWRVIRGTVARPRPPIDERTSVEPSRSWLSGVDARQSVIVVVDTAGVLAAVTIAGGTTAGAAALLTAVLALDILYRQPWRLAPAALDDLPAIAIRAIVGASVVAAAGFAVHGDAFALRATGTLATAGVYAGLAVGGRALGYAVIRQLQIHRWLVRSALIVGAGPMGAEIGRLLRDHPDYGLAPAGFVDAPAPARTAALPAPVLGDVPDLPALIARHRIRHVIVAFCQLRDSALVDVLRACDRTQCTIHVVPRMFELGATGAREVEHLWGVPLIRLPLGHRSRARLFKRAFDIVFAACALVLTGPVMLGIAAVLRFEVGPGVLFRQMRVGANGRHFVLLKFRTLRATPEGEPGVWSVVRADRMGPFGRFLRRSSLDELPQLWNVLRGHMSIVGPRPELPVYVARFVDRHRGYAARLRVPAGLTGFAQVHDLRGATSIEDRVRFDNLYIEHWSLWRDVRIVVATVASVLRLKGG